MERIEIDSDCRFSSRGTRKRKKYGENAGERGGERFLALSFSERNYSGDLRRTHGLGRHYGFSTRKRRENSLFLPHFGFEIPIAVVVARQVNATGKAEMWEGPMSSCSIFIKEILLSLHEPTFLSLSLSCR